MHCPGQSLLECPSFREPSTVQPKPLLARNPVVIVGSRGCIGGVWLFPLPRLSSESLWCLVCPHHFSRNSFPVDDGRPVVIRRKNLTGCMSDRVPKDELLAEGVVIDGQKCGTVVSVPRPTCGQEPSVGDATPTFLRGCMESICRHMSTRNARTWSASSSSAYIAQWAKKQSCESCATTSRGWRVSGRGQLCSSRSRSD